MRGYLAGVPRPLALISFSGTRASGARVRFFPFRVISVPTGWITETGRNCPGISLPLKREDRKRVNAVSAERAKT